MPRFFVENIAGDVIYITGEDARHIAKSLHMEPGRQLVVSDMQRTDYHCRIVGVTPEIVTLQIEGREPCASESRVPVCFYQALPKGDKLEFAVQKAVELGAAEITPVLTSRCISRPGDKAMDKKLARLQKIACEAAKQSGRGIIPKVKPLLSYEDALQEMGSFDLPILFYEESETSLGDILKPQPASVAVLIGSEGGFSQAEAAMAEAAGVLTAGLGKRILRCETAGVCALSVVMYHLGEF